MKTRIGDIDISYEISGSGPWLTLSHSLAAHLGMWEPLLSQLNQHFTVLRYDIRGHGQTQASEAPYSLTQLAQDAYGLLQQLGVKRTHWIGLSLGGMIGQTLAIQHPEVLDRVVIANSTARGAPNAAQMWADRAALARAQGMGALVQPTLSRWFTDPFRERHPDVMSHIGAMIGQTPVEGYAGCCAAIAQLDTLDDLQQLQLPCLVLVGDQDMATPPAMSEQMHQHWPNSQFTVLKDAAHLSSVEQAQAFNEAAIRFLQAS
jgi:3-oxoadipate enol-lactonase